MTWKLIDKMPYKGESGNVLKFYAAGTSTNINVAGDSAGTSQAASVALNGDGNPEIGGVVSLIYVDQDYKIALYTDQTAADADSGAIWTIDNVSSGITSSSDTNTDTLTVNETIQLGSVSPDSASDKSIIIENGTIDATSLANTIQITSEDFTAGNTTLSLRTEGTPLSNISTAVGSMAIRLNGSLVYLLASTAAGPDWSFGDTVADKVTVKRLQETAVAVTSISNVTTLDLNLGTYFTTTLTENTEIQLSNMDASFVDGVTLKITQDSTPRTISYPAGTLAADGGVAPTIATGSGEISYVIIHSDDGAVMTVRSGGDDFSAIP